jgi:hypothetical protein
VVLCIYYQWDQHFVANIVLFRRYWLQIDKRELASHFHFVDTDVNHPINVLKQFLGCSHANFNFVTAPIKIVPEGDLRNGIAGHSSSLLGNCNRPGSLRMAAVKVN